MMGPLCGNLFWFGVVWLMLFPFMDNMFDIKWPGDTVKWEKAAKKEVKTEEVKTEKEGFKRTPSKWDWQEYRRHSRDEAFVESSMWLSMGDD